MLIKLLFGTKCQGSIDSSRNRVFIATTYFFYFAQLGVFVPYVGLFLDDRGFSSSQIGTLLAMVAIARIIGPNLWASQADKKGKIGEVLRIGCFLAFFVFVAIFFVYEYWLLTLTFCLMMMFWTAVLPQLEVIAVTATKSSKGGYGSLRLWGSIGFVCFSLLAGLLIDVFSPAVIIFISCTILFFLYLCTLFVISPVNKVKSSFSSNVDWKQAFGLIFVVFMLANTLLQVSFGSYYNFFALYMVDLGYTGLQTGIFIALGVVAEVFIFIYASRLLKRFNVLALLAFSILITGFRWLGLAFLADNMLIIVLSQILHAFSFGLSHVASVSFLSTHFSPAFQSRAQALYVSVTFGLGSAIGSVVAGYLWKNGAGATVSFAFSAIAAFIAASILIMLHMQQQAKRGER